MPCSPGARTRWSTIERESLDMRDRLLEELLENRTDYKNFSAIVSLINEVGEPFEKRELDYRKLSTEFSKLIVINLQFINAGGLLAVPSLSASLLGFVNLSRSEKLYLIGVPMLLFTFGLMMANLLAFAAYKNYQAWTRRTEGSKEIVQNQIGARLAGTFGGDKTNIELDGKKAERKSELAQKSLERMYKLGHISGWLSVSSFVCSCVFLGFNAR